MSKDVPRNRADSSCIGKICFGIFVACKFKKDLNGNNDVDDDKMMI